MKLFYNIKKHSPLLLVGLFLITVSSCFSEIEEYQEDATPLIRFDVHSAQLSEFGDPLTVSIISDRVATEDMVVSLQLETENIEANTNFTVVNNSNSTTYSLTIPAGETHTELSIAPIVNDNSLDIGTISLTIQSVTGGQANINQSGKEHIIYFADQPGVFASTETLDLGIAYTGGFTEVNEFTLSGFDISETLVVTAQDGFVISKDGIQFSESINFTASEVNTDTQTVFVRYNATEVGVYSSTIEITSDGIDTKVVNVNATVEENIASITTDPETLDFGDVREGAKSILPLKIMAESLVDDITLTSAAPFLISTTEDNFSSELILEKSTFEATGDITIYVEFTSLDADNPDKLGVLQFQSIGANAVETVLKGKTVLIYDLLAYTSFEEVPTFDSDYTYRKTETIEQENKQVSTPSADDPYVDYAEGATETGFDSSFLSTDIGDSSSEKLGVYSNATINYANSKSSTPVPTQFEKGTQGFITADLDGTWVLKFDDITMPAGATKVRGSFTVFFADTTWETSDVFTLYYETADGLGTPIRDILEPEMEEIEGNWITIEFEFPEDKIKDGSLLFHIKNGVDDEMILLDEVKLEVLVR